MIEKIPCTECGVVVLPGTAERTGGLCMPCKNGYRKDIELAKERHRKERELDKTCPFRALSRELVDKVYKEEGGFSNLTENEKSYYSVISLVGSVYGDGFVQYFETTSGNEYLYAELGLDCMAAPGSLKILRQAKVQFQGSSSIPQYQAEPGVAISKHFDEPDLDELDIEFYKDPDQIDKLLKKFAIDSGLVKIHKTDEPNS